MVKARGETGGEVWPGGFGDVGSCLGDGLIFGETFVDAWVEALGAGWEQDFKAFGCHNEEEDS